MLANSTRQINENNIINEITLLKLQCPSHTCTFQSNQVFKVLRLQLQ